MTATLSTDFRIDHLNAQEREVALIVLSVLPPDASGGGCPAFRPTKDHRARREQFGLDAVLILVHDGGDLAPYCNYDHERYNLIEQLDKALRAKGFYCENCTTWYSAVYPV